MADSLEIVARVRTLPRERLGAVLSLVGRLGSRPGALLETAMPSPGEIRKLMIAFGVLGRPWLMVMDEPTNHLDIVSIRCLEQALSESRAALLVVSHDRRLVENLVRRRWHFAVDGAREVVLRITGTSDW